MNLALLIVTVVLEVEIVALLAILFSKIVKS